MNEINEIKEKDIENIFEFKDEFIFNELEYEFIDLTEIEERHYRIQQISQDATLLNEIFKDLRELVYGQQDSIDSIESNIGKAKENVEYAEEELIKAEIYQSKSFRKYIVLSSMLIAGVSTPIGVTLGIKAGLGTAGGLGIGSMLFKMI